MSGSPSLSKLMIVNGRGSCGIGIVGIRVIDTNTVPLVCLINLTTAHVALWLGETVEQADTVELRRVTNGQRPAEATGVFITDVPTRYGDIRERNDQVPTRHG